MTLDYKAPSALKRLSVLVTRPAEPGVELARLIEQKGGHPTLFPTIEIKPLPLKPSMQAALKNLSHFDIAVFISTPAVTFSMPTIQTYWPAFPAHLTTLAVGPGTAKTLAQFNIQADHPPPSQASVDYLLKQPVLTQVQGKSILLFRGIGGRRLLAGHLKKRGAALTEIICYQRTLPAVDTKICQKIICEQTIDIIICTSVNSLKNCFKLFGKQGQAWLFNQHWIVISHRIKDAALKLGIKTTPIVADTPSNDAILNALIQFVKEL